MRRTWDMKTAAQLRGLLREMLIRLDPVHARLRQFRFLDHISQSDIDRKKIEPELLLLPFFLDKEKYFVDIGSNAGEFVYVALRSIAPSHIYAFEPQATLASRLRVLFPGIHVEQCALSNTSGTVRLKIPVIAGSLYRARGTIEQIVEEGEAGAEFENVRTCTLDSLSTEFKTPIGCIKIDVEGHERSVIEGALATLHRDKPTIIIEIEQRHHSEPIRDIFALVQKNGYAGYFYDISSEHFIDITEFKTETHQRQEDFKTSRYVNNFIFAPHSKSIPRNAALRDRI